MVDEHELTLDFFWETAREQIWVKPGFQEQLILFGLCGYAPSAKEPIYRNWRARMDAAMQGISRRVQQTN
jgi:dual specificity phosphatase 12